MLEIIGAISFAPSMFRLNQLQFTFASSFVFVAVCWSLGLAGGVMAQDQKPFGLAKREIWQNTRLIGTPETPPPYTVEKIYTNQVWRAPMFIAPEPGGDQLFALLHESNG